jgi:hypothetical protein
VKSTQAQAEKFKEVEKERKALIGPEDVESEPEPPRKKRRQTVQEAKKKHIQLRENLRNLVKQTQANEIIDREDKEKQYGPITQMLGKVEKAVILTVEDLSKTLGLLPKFRPKQLTFGSEEPKPLPATSEDEDVEEKSIKTIIDKGTGVTSKGLVALPRKYLRFPDNKFGI